MISRTSRFPQGARLCVYAAVTLAGIGPALGHVNWTRANTVDPSTTLGLYHFDDTNTTFGSELQAASGLPSSRNLVVGNTAGAGMQPSAFVKSGVFGPGSVEMLSVQTCSSSETLTTATTPLLGDLTIEGYVAWPSGPGNTTSSSLQLGLGTGIKLQLTRDSATPSNDRYGIATVHGGYISVPSFTDWPTLGSEEAPLDEWLHFGLCIHSTGATPDPSDPDHYFYDAGSTARFYLNGHLAGILDIGNLTAVRCHDFSVLRVAMLAGTGLYVDEFTVWTQDWSNNGATISPFSDGRGPLPAGVNDWRVYNP